MIRTRVGQVIDVIEARAGISEVKVKVEDKIERAINYEWLTGKVRAREEVLLNTTAVYKKLGTGGTHFVMANLNNPQKNAKEAGHIIKVRYTPAQVKVLAVEEEDHPENHLFRATRSLNGTPVIIGSLHSMLGPVAAVIHKLTYGKARLVYVMTDGGALPVILSKLVAELKQKGLIAATVSCGHAFGGDYEAVTVYSGLLIAKGVVKADIIFVAMGPGIAGTASEFGHTGLEQGELVNAVNILEGSPVAIPRLSFSDPRERHMGLSHHTRTALGRVALTRCTLVLPKMAPDREEYVKRQLDADGLSTKHQIIYLDASVTLEALRQYDLNVTTMGRAVREDPEFFLAAGAAGIYAVSLIS